MNKIILLIIFTIYIQKRTNDIRSSRFGSRTSEVENDKKKEIIGSKYEGMSEQIKQIYEFTCLFSDRDREDTKD